MTDRGLPERSLDMEMDTGEDGRMGPAAARSSRQMIATVVSVLAFGLLLVTLVVNSSATLSVRELERRCTAAYLSGDAPQFAAPTYSFIYGGRTGSVYEAASVQMHVIDTPHLQTRPESQTRLTFTCTSKPGGRIRLRRW